MPVIGVDLDGVVGDFTAHLASFIYDEGSDADCGKPFPPPDSWGFNNWNLETDFETYYEQFIQGGYYATMPFVHGAIATLGLIRDLGWHIHIITNRGTSTGSTARNHKAIKDTMTWLFDNNVPHDMLSFVKDKTKIVCDAMVEDAPHHLDAFMKKLGTVGGVTPEIIAMAQPYNKQFRNCFGGTHCFTYAQDWNDVLALVQDIDEFMHGNGATDAEDRLSR